MAVVAALCLAAPPKSDAFIIREIKALTGAVVDSVQRIGRDVTRATGLRRGAYRNDGIYTRSELDRKRDNALKDYRRTVKKAQRDIRRSSQDSDSEVAKEVKRARERYEQQAKEYEKEVERQKKEYEKRIKDARSNIADNYQKRAPSKKSTKRSPKNQPANSSPFFQYRNENR